MQIDGWRVEALGYESREDWLELRRQDLTASEAGALFGAHKYLTLRQLAVEKAFGENKPETSVMRRGKIMEPAVAEAVRLDFGWRPVRVDTYLRGRAADPYLRAGATRDYMLPALSRDSMLAGLREQALALGWDQLGDEVNLALECKSVDERVFDAEWGEHPPKYILVQAAMQAALAGAHGTIVACLVENRARDLFLYAVPRKPAFELELFERIADFWRRWEASEEFAVEAKDNAGMAELYPQAENELVIDLTAEAEEWQGLAAERARLKMQIETIKSRIDEIEARFKDRLRGAVRAILPGWSITWKTNSAGVRTFKCDKATALSQTQRKRR